MDPVERERWRAREEPLRRAESLYDVAYMDHVLHPDFTEFGRSGRTYDRGAIRARRRARSAPRCRSPSHGLPADAGRRARDLRERGAADELDVANRTSIWIRVDDEWRLRFHQGTPTTGRQRRPADR